MIRSDAASLQCQMLLEPKRESVRRVDNLILYESGNSSLGGKTHSKQRGLLTARATGNWFYFPNSAGCSHLCGAHVIHPKKRKQAKARHQQSSNNIRGHTCMVLLLLKPLHSGNHPIKADCGVAGSAGMGQRRIPLASRPRLRILQDDRYKKFAKTFGHYWIHMWHSSV